MVVKNRIKWKVVDQLLEETKSSPRDLLDWLEWGFGNIDNNGSHICNVRLYLDKYYITDEDSVFVGRGSQYITLPEIMTGRYQMSLDLIPSTVWLTLSSDLEFRKVMISRFKKHYKLK